MTALTGLGMFGDQVGELEDKIKFPAENTKIRVDHGR
jgi:hypothetical protein